jgi:hypothetical protein
VQRPLLVDLDQARILERVVLADVLDEAAVARRALVGVALGPTLARSLTKRSSFNSASTSS